MSLCINYQGTLNHRGYGVFGALKHHRSNRVIRQIMAAIHGWDALEGKSVLHSCDNPSCVNVAHLRIGTQAENRQDAVDRGRMRNARGEAQASAKLTEHAVRWIRSLYDTGDYTLAELGEMFGVRYQTIRQVVSRVTWRHV